MSGSVCLAWLLRRLPLVRVAVGVAATMTPQGGIVLVGAMVGEMRIWERRITLHFSFSFQVHLVKLQDQFLIFILSWVLLHFVHMILSIVKRYSGSYSFGTFL